MEPVAVSEEGRVATIRMHDPLRRNALGPAMLDGLNAAFDGLGGRDVRAVVLRAGPDDPVWCAGFDIKALRPGADPLAHEGALQALFRRVRDCPAPVIAMLHGSAWGGGTGNALRCSSVSASGPTERRRSKVSIESTNSRSEGNSGASTLLSVSPSKASTIERLCGSAP